MPTVIGRWANLLFSQRNNPYCDLLRIYGKYTTFLYMISYLIEFFLKFDENFSAKPNCKCLWKKNTSWDLTWGQIV